MQTFKNGRIFIGLDSNNNPKFAEAMSIDNGKFCFIGSNSEVDCNNAIDLQSNIVIPSFVDSHTHPDYVADNTNRVLCLPPLIHSIAEMKEAFRKHKDFGTDKWLEGFGYDEAVLKEGRAPTCKDLDEISTTQVVLAYHSSGHILSCNSLGLKIAGITKDSKDPSGGKIGFFEDGSPNGILYEPNAMKILLDNRPKPDFEMLVNRMVEVGKKYDRLGIGALTDMFCFYEPYNRIDLYREARKRGFKQNITLYYLWDSIKKNGRKPIINEDDDIKIGGVKLFIDGSIAGKTAYMLRNYPNENHRGMMCLEKEDILDAMEYAREHKLQLAIHAMGDASIEFLIQTLKDVEPWLDSDTPTVRIEHASLISDSQLRAMKEAKMTFALAPQTIFLYAEYDAYLKSLDDDLFKRVYAIKSYDKFLLTSLSSDAPATLWATPENLYATLSASVARKTPDGRDMNQDEAVSVGEALVMMSKNGAKISRMDNDGEIRCGAYANFQVLDKDIFSMNPNHLADVLPVQTYIRGDRVFA